MKQTVKRRMSVYNRRYKNNGGFRIEIVEEKVVLYREYSGKEWKLATLEPREGLYPCHLHTEKITIPLLTPGAIQDFLYYGMAILEDKKGDQK